MDKGLTVPKWVMIVRPKIPQMPQNLFAQIVCLSPKVWDSDAKRLQWASVVRGAQYQCFHAWVFSFVQLLVRDILFYFVEYSS